jgi:2-polyprenyl-3-methyl-5-hydroxy-6-metoxy-1,4-benzoquinol methylase
MTKTPAKSKARDVESQVAKCYSTWGTTYFRDYYQSKNAYPPVHQDLVKRELKAHGAKTLLDAGCGPASMLRGLKFFGTKRYGFDLTPEMVDEAQRVLGRQGVPSNQVWLGSVLDPQSYRPTGAARSFRYDSAICFGVLPHIPPAADMEVFTNLRASLKRGGLAMVEARNELFSLFTANRYSHAFMKDRLIRADGLLKKAGPQKLKIQGALEAYENFFRMDLPPIRKGKQDEPGYDEVLSRLHNPLEAREQFAEAGFKNVRVLFYHYHCLPPMFEASVPDFFRKESLLMENPEDWRGYFMASAFVLAGTAA